MAVPVVLQIADHLFRCPLDPLWGLGVWALVPAQGAQVLGLGLDYAASVVVGERILGVLGLRFGPVGVSVAERPGVWAHGGSDAEADANLRFC